MERQSSQTTLKGTHHDCSRGPGSRMFRPSCWAADHLKGNDWAEAGSKKVAPSVGVHFLLCGFFLVCKIFPQLNDVLDLVPHSAILFSSETSYVQILSRESVK
uniref:Uncharacterized protein n=1 Tax=Panthera leo TaxID=9689 RepID=A0A8C8WLM5_PANLE